MRGCSINAYHMPKRICIPNLPAAPSGMYSRRSGSAWCRIGRFDGLHALPAAVSKTCLVRFDNNKYSVPATAVGRPVEIHAYADRIVIRQDGQILTEHERCFRREQTIYDPW